MADIPIPRELVERAPTLYGITGDIKDINTLLIPRSALTQQAEPVLWVNAGTLELVRMAGKATISASSEKNAEEGNGTPLYTRPAIASAPVGDAATQPEGQEAHPDLPPLRRFAAAMMRTWPDAGVDGFDLQDAAETAGLLLAVDMTVPCGAGCTCRDYYDDGQQARCYQVQPVLARARAVQAGGGK